MSIPNHARTMEPNAGSLAPLSLVTLWSATSVLSSHTRNRRVPPLTS